MFIIDGFLFESKYFHPSFGCFFSTTSQRKDKAIFGLRLPEKNNGQAILQISNDTNYKAFILMGFDRQPLLLSNGPGSGGGGGGGGAGVGARCDGGGGGRNIAALHALTKGGRARRAPLFF